MSDDWIRQISEMLPDGPQKRFGITSKAGPSYAWVERDGRRALPPEAVRRLLLGYSDDRS